MDEPDIQHAFGILARSSGLEQREELNVEGWTCIHSPSADRRFERANKSDGANKGDVNPLANEWDENPLCRKAA